MLNCCSCNKILPFESFSIKNNTSRGYSYKCKKCHNEYCRTIWYVKNKDKQYSANKRNRENNKVRYTTKRLKLEDNEGLASAMENIKSCEICNKEVKLVVDHCHLRNKFRGMLCSNCNTGLGMFYDNINNLLGAIKYLENR